MPEKSPTGSGKLRKRQLAPRKASTTENYKAERRCLDPMREAFGIRGYSPTEAVAKFFAGWEAVPIHVLFPPQGIRAGSFAVWGKTSANDATYKPIVDLVGIAASPGRTATETYDLEEATIVDHLSGQHWYDVRLVPVIDAPNAAYFLDELTLAEAFDRFILGNPEVEPALNEAARLCPRVGERILRRKYLDDTSRLPLPLWAAAFPMRFLSFMTEPDASEEARASAWRLGNLLHDKAMCLFDLLAAGRIFASGVNPVTRQRIEVDPQAWTRRGFSADVRSSDIVDTTADRIEWRDVVLRAPAPAALADDEPAPPIRMLDRAGGRREQHDYLAALDEMFKVGDLETEAQSGAALTSKMLDAFERLGIGAPGDARTVERWFAKNLPALWRRATGGG